MLKAAAELYFSTSDVKYKTVLEDNKGIVVAHPEQCAEFIGRLVSALKDTGWTSELREAVRQSYQRTVKAQTENPYGVPYKPYIWGAGWGIQAFGVTQLFLHMAFPDDYPAEYAFNALNFVLGCHPGQNTASFVSGVGERSLTVAYGANRDDWSYIPGGVASGTALIRPDLPELKTWPYFWQQTEYVLGGGTVDFLILAMAADKLFNK
jgi:hypothetical protein